MLGQTVIFLDEQFMRVFGSLVGDGAVSLLNYARRIMQGAGGPHGTGGRRGLLSLPGLPC